VKSKIVIGTIVVVATVGLGAWLVLHHDKKPSTSHKSPAITTPDTMAPFVQLNITQSSLLSVQKSKSLEVSVKSSDYEDITRVDYLVDGAVVEQSFDSPFTVTIDLSELAGGKHTLQAVAYDAAANAGKSEEFAFLIQQDKPVTPANKSSQSVVRQSTSTASLGDGKSSSGSSGHHGGGSDDGGEDPGGDPDDGDDDTTPWPDAPIAQICGDIALLRGPSSAPAGAITVPAGDNSGVDFTLANKTYWFAPGTHTLGDDIFGQIIPGNNAKFIGGPDAVLDGQGLNNFAFTQHATNVTIKYLTVKNFIAPADQGVVNHDSGVGWDIEYNTMENNGGAALFLGTNNTAKYNCLRDNGQYGFQVYSSDVGGPTNVLLDHNEVSGNNTDNLEVDGSGNPTGCGCTGGGKFWEAHNVTITNNYVHDNLSVGLWADTNDSDFLVEGNYISGNNGQGLFYEISYNMIVRNNNFVRNALVDGAKNAGFPTGAIYLSESGGDARVAGRTANIDIYDNQFTDNWSGVVLWENADRFCSSPANTSSGTCTMVNPDATTATCTDPASGGSVDEEPYLSDCRWKTQNVKVHNNNFNLTKANITDCATTESCGQQGIFSNVGTFPTWSPYKGSGIQDDITFNQNNLFSNNTYLGDWHFRAKTQDSLYNFAFWQAAPFNQDVGSTFNGQAHLAIENALDDDTATLEGSIGEWTSWFSSSVARIAAEAHSGTHSLQVTIGASFGWGVQLTDPTGFPVLPTDKTISFWAKLGSGTNLATRMEVQWLDEDQNLLSTTVLTSPTLTSEWQKTSTTVTPPVGAATANIVFVHGSGTTGNTLYLDDISIADN
jgi:hypothetical protein